MRPVLALTAGLVFGAAALAQSGNKPLPPDLAAVPNDAFAFGHVRLADLWKNEALKDVRGVLQKAGPKALEALDKRFSPAPSTIERLTIYLPTPNFDAGRPEFDFVFIVGVNQPYDREKLSRQLGK